MRIITPALIPSHGCLEEGAVQTDIPPRSGINLVFMQESKSKEGIWNLSCHREPASS